MNVSCPYPDIAGKRSRVMIVDDSAVIRTVISRTLRAHDDIEVVGTTINGDEAVKNVKRLDPDIIILDIEMPVMDGLTALPLLLKEKPNVRILICSTLSERGAEVSIKALSLGAADYILKPGGDAIVSASEFQENLVKSVRSLSLRLKRTTGPHGASPARKPEIRLRANSMILPPRIIAIGSSTGGPKVLMDVMADLSGLPVPVVITQHMPKSFTAMLAQHITQNCGLPCHEGAQGDALKPGHAYVAPGGYHMAFHKSGDNVLIQLNEDAPENYCRPSVNPMLRSLIPIYGERILVIMLTGMGNDGSQLCADVVKHGGCVIAQDEATSTVWGMPGAVATAGLCSAVLPANEISGWVKRAVKGI